MKLGYFLNAYPMTSTTFIRREIEAHERSGITIDRFAIRRWDQPLVDPRDSDDAKKTFYLLEQAPLHILRSVLSQSIRHPLRTSRALAAAVAMAARARGKRLKHIAYFIEAAALKQEATRRRIDHLHTHFSTNSATVALLSHLMGGPSYSLTIHGPDELWEMRENSLALKVRHATFVAAISNYCLSVVNEFTRRQYEGKIRIVRCGLDLRDFPRPSDVPDSHTLVCVGRLCKAKAQVLLVEAFAGVVGKFPRARLVLIGDGELRSAIEERIARLDLGENVVLAGWKKNPEVAEALTNARALVLPSLAEGLPIVIMESFALGRPVLTTRINGIPELVDATCGWLAEPGDPSSLQDCLEQLLSAEPQALSEMGRAGRVRVEQWHDQDRNAAELRGHIRSFLRDRA
ncbi:glycosyltransferase family 4 protein [Defluviimonas sp. WL0002]|uniref:Glycosyltransferase family 4 protein n=1 Tax=Albidovulum marisflavi TaxID=2984159 RepID=A0ABT2ZCQ0_9RHOB|nr:glycosyltransferase family 4 protein [Defluviimonas sp. WL0002]MCV2868904.1 glycosyltransferase family 4 protein [Defluviimonas sp. WL0002]